MIKIKGIRIVLVGIVGIVLIGLLTYGGYWVVKTVSYKIFYSGMVKTTVTNMVKTECLN